MSMGDIIPPDRVLVGLRVNDKAQLLRELAERAAGAVSLDGRLIIDRLQTRENLGSTGLGKGFALPHARLPALPQRFALFARLARPIDFMAIDDCPVDLVILLLTPADGGNEHLATLAALARPMRDERFLQRLRSAADARALHEVLNSA